jgi:BlaI family penicillinase repressor
MRNHERGLEGQLPMLKAKRHYLARRETELLDILYRRGRATAVEILSECAGSRSYSTVRTQRRVLVQKGHVKRTLRGGRHMYVPSTPLTVARDQALRHLLDTFFDGSLENAVRFALGSVSFALADDARARLRAIHAHCAGTRRTTEGDGSLSESTATPGTSPPSRRSRHGAHTSRSKR